MATEEQIKELAYFLWEKEGCPEGRHLEHYSIAKQTLEEQEAGQGDIQVLKEYTFEEELKNATQKLIEERQKAIKQLIDEHLIAIREVVEEERKAISSKTESLKKSIFNGVL